MDYLFFTLTTSIQKNSQSKLQIKTDLCIAQRQKNERTKHPHCPQDTKHKQGLSYAESSFLRQRPLYLQDGAVAQQLALIGQRTAQSCLHINFGTKRNFLKIKSRNLTKLRALEARKESAHTLYLEQTYHDEIIVLFQQGRPH